MLTATSRCFRRAESCASSPQEKNCKRVPSRVAALVRGAHHLRAQSKITPYDWGTYAKSTTAVTPRLAERRFDRPRRIGDRMRPARRSASDHRSRNVSDRGDPLRQSARRRVERHQDVQGHSLRRIDRRQESLHAAEAARILDRRLRRVRLRADRAADADRSTQSLLRHDPVGSSAWRHRRRLPGRSTSGRRASTTTRNALCSSSTTAAASRAGSGNSIGFDGDQAARYDDVVVVSVNHRLSSFGFLGSRRTRCADGVQVRRRRRRARHGRGAASGSKRTSSRFGGDPDRVMIFGQSGGGAKTSTLLAMPGAKGLFQRAGVQSGSALRLMTPEAATKSAEKFLKVLNIQKDRHRRSAEAAVHATARCAGDGADRLLARHRQRRVAASSVRSVRAAGICECADHHRLHAG